MILSMRKLFTKKSGQSDGSLLVETVIVAHSINSQILDEKFSIREEGFLDLANERELILSRPKIYVCNNSTIRNIAQAQAGEKVFVVRQVHQENWI
jgi:hypothetical protein